MLAIVYELDKFNQFTFGKHVTVYSDHKPQENSRMCAKTPARKDYEASKVRPGSSLRKGNRNAYCILPISSRFTIRSSSSPSIISAITWKIDKLNNTLDSTAILKLKSHFARYGCPDQVVSDNGPQFDCEEFRKFQSIGTLNKPQAALVMAKSMGEQNLL